MLVAGAVMSGFFPSSFTTGLSTALIVGGLVVEDMGEAIASFLRKGPPQKGIAGGKGLLARLREYMINRKATDPRGKIFELQNIQYPDVEGLTVREILNLLSTTTYLGEQIYLGEVGSRGVINEKVRALIMAKAFAGLPLNSFEDAILSITALLHGWGGPSEKQFNKILDVSPVRSPNTDHRLDPASDYHHERRFMLKLVFAFFHISYKGGIKLPGYFELHSEGSFTGETSALLELGRLFKQRSGTFYQFGESLFKDAWQKNTRFWPATMDRLEHFYMYSRALTARQRGLSLMAVQDYRASQGYFTRDPRFNGREWDLARTLQTALSNQLGHYISISEMAIMFKGRKVDLKPKQDDFFRRRLYTSTRMRFSTKSLKDLMDFVTNPIEWKFGVAGNLRQYRVQLAGVNLALARNAILDYQNIVWGAVRSPYLIPANAPNGDELLILEILRLAYSKHPHLNPNYGVKEISQKTLFEDIIGLKRTFDRYLDNNIPFSSRLLTYIYRHARMDLLQWHAPQEYADLCRAMSIYSREFKSYWITDQRLLSNLRFAPTSNQYPSTWTSTVKRMQREVLAVWFATRDALTGDRILGTASLHHWQISNPFRKVDCSLSYNLNTGRLPALVPLSKVSHGKVGNNPIYEQTFRDALLSVLRGRPPRHWSLANKKAFIRYKWLTARPYF